VAEVIVTEAEDDGEPALEDEAAHAAAVHQGAAEVHAERAEEAAAEAGVAAAVAEAGVSAAADVAERAEEAAARSEAAAAAANEGALAVARALEALPAALQSFQENMSSAHVQPEPAREPVKKKTDKAPEPKKKRSFRDRYYGL
jgi:inorganic triphosphatase YgiF